MGTKTKENDLCWRGQKREKRKVMETDIDVKHMDCSEYNLNDNSSRFDSYSEMEKG